MTAFDPAKVRFEWEGSGDNGLAPALCLNYGDEKHYQNTLLDGIRMKFPLPEHGVMLKVEVMSKEWSSGVSVASGQGFSEWITWEKAPRRMKRNLQPIVAYAVCPVTYPGNPAWGSPAREEAVCWVAQEWAERHPEFKRPHVKTYVEMEKRMESFGFRVRDGGSRQTMIRADGRRVFLDYGGWDMPQAIRQEVMSTLNPRVAELEAKRDRIAPVPRRLPVNGTPLVAADARAELNRQANLRLIEARLLPPAKFDAAISVF